MAFGVGAQFIAPDIRAADGRNELRPYIVFVVFFVLLTYMGEAVPLSKACFAPLNDIAPACAMAGHRLRCSEW
jgi:hypothetical protein